MFEIRKAEAKDLNRIKEIYGTARKFMRDNGNSSQWGGGDAPELLLEDDIKLGQLYVLGEGEIHASFAFIKGEDPMYRIIEDGSWITDSEYAAVHRVASDGTVKNVLNKVMEYCKEQIPHIRIDSHEDNKVMQHVLEKNGFERRGTVYAGDKTPRIAFEWVGESLKDA